MSPFNRIITTCILLAIFVSPLTLARDTSILLLPSHIPAPAGQISLYADYGSIQGDGRVPVYLINKSTQDLILNTQDGDIYLKLQYQDSDGNWARAQPHGYSWCGNSYVNRVVRSGFYQLVSGYQPISGIPATVRYRVYGQDIEIISNPGDGVVTDLDINHASSDVMSIHEGTFEYVAKVALSDVPVTNTMDHMRDLRQMAIWELSSGRFDVEESYQVLLRVRERNSDMTEAADRALGVLSERLAESGTESN